MALLASEKVLNITSEEIIMKKQAKRQDKKHDKKISKKDLKQISGGSGRTPPPKGG
jgi:bacteriocin-like protein